MPRERLLEYELGSGWPPICKFLGKDVPDREEFPWAGESKLLEEKGRVLSERGLMRALSNLVVVGSAGLVVAVAVYGLCSYERGDAIVCYRSAKC